MQRKKKWLIVAVLAIVGLGWLFVLHGQLALPNMELLKQRNPVKTAFMERYEGHSPLQFSWVSYSKISPYLKQAVVIAEDSTFFDHKGVDWQAMWEAVEKNWRKKEIVRGGSTITQQLAKNLYLSPSRNPFRKFKELLIAVQLEQTISKQRILEIYLNVIEWGEGIYGAEAAARYYFHTNASALGPSEAAWLAAILPNPRFYQKHRASTFLNKKVATILGRLGY